MDKEAPSKLLNSDHPHHHHDQDAPHPNVENFRPENTQLPSSHPALKASGQSIGYMAVYPELETAHAGKEAAHQEHPDDPMDEMQRYLGTMPASQFPTFESTLSTPVESHSRNEKGQGRPTDPVEEMHRFMPTMPDSLFPVFSPSTLDPAALVSDDLPVSMSVVSPGAPSFPSTTSIATSAATTSVATSTTAPASHRSKRYPPSSSFGPDHSEEGDAADDGSLMLLPAPYPQPTNTGNVDPQDMVSTSRVGSDGSMTALQSKSSEESESDDTGENARVITLPSPKVGGPDPPMERRNDGGKPGDRESSVVSSVAVGQEENLFETPSPFLLHVRDNLSTLSRQAAGVDRQGTFDSPSLNRRPGGLRQPGPLSTTMRRVSFRVPITDPSQTLSETQNDSGSKPNALHRLESPAARLLDRRPISTSTPSGRGPQPNFVVESPITPSQSEQQDDASVAGPEESFDPDLGSRLSEKDNDESFETPLRDVRQSRAPVSTTGTPEDLRPSNADPKSSDMAESTWVSRKGKERLPVSAEGDRAVRIPVPDDQSGVESLEEREDGSPNAESRDSTSREARLFDVSVGHSPAVGDNADADGVIAPDVPITPASQLPRRDSSSTGRPDDTLFNELSFRTPSDLPLPPNLMPRPILSDTDISSQTDGPETPRSSSRRRPSAHQLQTPPAATKRPRVDWRREIRKLEVTPNIFRDLDLNPRPVGPGAHDAPQARRSERTRIESLRWWANEKAVYKAERTADGTTERRIVDVLRPAPATPVMLPTPARERDENKETKPVVSPYHRVFNAETGKEEMAWVIMRIDKDTPRISGPDDQFEFVRGLNHVSSDGFETNSGVIYMKKGGCKPERMATMGNIHCCVLWGAVEVTINGTSVPVPYAGAFTVLRGNAWSLKNIAKTQSRVYYVRSVMAGRPTGE